LPEEGNCGPPAGQGLVLRALGELEEAFGFHKKAEALALEAANKDELHRSYANQALILQEWGRLREAMELLKKQEAISLDLGNKNSLQYGYSIQALTLTKWGRLDEAMELLKKQEALSSELGHKSGLGHCYWYWGRWARAKGDRATEQQKLQQALALFTELNMPLERDAVQAELDRLNSGVSG
jgi:tetratricopeptide (TPR) repeat protein